LGDTGALAAQACQILGTLKIKFQTPPARTPAVAATIGAVP